MTITHIIEHYPASHAQKRIWVLSQMQGASAAYNISAHLHLKGAVNKRAFEQAFQAVINRHESLRTIFREIDDEVRQVVLDDVKFEIKEYQLSDNKQEILLHTASLDQSKLDLERGPLMEVALASISTAEYVLSIVVHHIISDGLSMQVLIQELFENYRSFCKGKSLAKTPLTHQYKDYAILQEQQEKNGSLQKAEAFWQNEFLSSPEPLKLPLDFHRPAVKTFDGNIARFYLSAAAGEGINEFCKINRASPFNFLRAALNVLLYKITGQTEITIGTAVSGRSRSMTERQIGLFINTLPLKTVITPGETFAQLLERVSRHSFSILRNHEYPFDRIVELAGAARDLSRNPLFDVLMVLQDYSLADKWDDIKYQDQLEVRNLEDVYPSTELENVSSKLDMSFNFVKQGDGRLLVEIEYASKLFRKDTIERLFDIFSFIITQALESSTIAVRDIEMVGKQERQLLLESFNNTAAVYAKNKTIIQLFEQTVNNIPGTVAVVCNDTEISYSELNASANRLSDYLRNKYGIRTGNLVALKLERTEWMIISILAVLKAGAAYVPIDPGYPGERIEYMLHDSNCKLVLDAQEIVAFLGSLQVYSPYNNPAQACKPGDLAYVIYTSGSTGKPKGVMIEHGNVVAMFQNLQKRFFIEKGMVAAATTNYTFDISVLELLGTLACGMKIILIQGSDPAEVIKCIIEKNVEVLQLTPSRLMQLAEVDQNGINALKKLKVLLIGGEALTPMHYNILKEHAPEKLINVYGPTETTIWSSSAEVFASPVITIGKPLLNEKIFILNNDQQLCAIGVEGEICISGAGVARGYLNNKALTAEKFIPDPFNKRKKMYRTGDRGRWLQDGNIEFLGRIDEQVKIRGFRIELGEIENAISSFENIDACVVIARAVHQPEKELVAYVVSKNTINVSELRSRLAGKLPSYMVPSYFVQIEQLPLNSSGKTDKKRLPNPESEGIEENKTYVAPNNPVEEKLVAIWQQVLGKERISVNENFFDLGGHSLKATRLASRIHKTFEVKLSLTELLSVPVLRDQATLIAAAVKTSFSEILQAAEQSSYALSSSQRRLWVLSQFEAGNIAYNMPGVYVFEGEVNIKALEDAFNALIDSHEILRTVFKENEQGEVRQFILSSHASSFKIDYFDVRTEPGKEEIVDRAVKQSIKQSFDLVNGPLLRAALYKVDENKYVFCYVMHHIISDGWSMNILLKELIRLYNSFTSGQSNSLAPLSIQYKDYAAWQQQQLSGSKLDEHKLYWLDRFQGELPTLELQGDKPRPAIKTYNGAVIEKQFSRELSESIQELGRTQESTLFMSLLAAVNALLYRYTNQQDIIIGTAIAGRSHAALEDQIGFYVNTLALRTKFDAQENFTSLLDKVKEVTLGAYRNAEYPFDELVDELNLERDVSRSPLFDVMVLLQNAGEHKDFLQLGQANVRSYGKEDVIAKFDLSFNFTETGNGLLLQLEYNNDIYSSATATRIAEYVSNLLESVVNFPSVAIEKIEYLGEEEKRRLLVDFNNTAVLYPKDKTIIDLFEEQVKNNPDNIAIVFEKTTLSYRLLNESSNRFAAYLRAEYDLRPNERAGILLERNEWLIVAILGVLKSGGAYVPIDIAYPQERINYMLADSNCKLVIDQHELERFKQVRQEYSTENPERVSGPGDLSYVIYTSGSTGAPKGVMIEHRSAYAFVMWCRDEFKNSKFDIVFAGTSVCFDLSVFEIFYTLSTGKPVRILANALDAPMHLATAQNVLLNTVPGVLGHLLDTNANLGAVTVLNLAGEPIPASYIARLDAKKIEIRNLYGPSEDTTYSTVYRIKNDQPILVGRPIANTQVYILSASRQLQPIGVAGEICISGAGLARGYLNNESLTQGKFIDHPFRKAEKMYRTGDRGRWLDDANIEFLGRIDEQIKIRGFRIEPGEIENAIASFENIEACMVIARTVHQTEKELVAYVVSKTSLSISDLRTHLSGKLPSFMVPSYFVQLEQLPLTSNGKTDKKKLPSPQGTGIEMGEIYVAPRNSTEEMLAAIWQEVLGKERIGATDNFFSLGGHSLKATRLASRIHKTFEVKLSLTELFSAPVLEDQAKLIAAAVKTSFSDISQAPVQSSYTLSSSQRRLWVLSQFEAGNIAYNMPGVYTFEGMLNRKALENAFNALIDRHEILRTLFKEDEQGEVRQFILSSNTSAFNIHYHDFRNEINKEERVRKFVEQSITQSFNLSNGPLLRAELCQVDEDKYVFCYVMHHIISDGWSMSVLLKELVQLYNSFIKEEVNPLTPPRIQYKDYAAWQQQQLNGSILEEHKSYWLQQFQGELPVLELPADKIRPAIKTYNGATVHNRFDARITAGIRAFSHSQNGTLFMGLTAAVYSLLYRYTGQQDIIIGSQIAGRNHADLENQLGLYLNTLALRLQFSGTDSFTELFEKLRGITLDAYAHQAYPFDELVDALQLQRDMSRHPLFDVSVVLQNADVANGNYHLHNLQLKNYESENLLSKFDLAFDFVEEGEEIAVSLVYNTDIYSHKMAVQLLAHLQQLLIVLIASPNESLSRFDYLSPEEKKQLLFSFNDTDASYPEHKTLVDLFEEQVLRTPANIALAFEETSLTYDALNKNANRLANFLCAHYAIQPDDLVGVQLPRGEWMVIAMLAILKSGGAYVPIDPLYPEERIAYMISDSHCKAVIDEEMLRLFLNAPVEYSSENLITINRPGDLAYVIYTSGTTGKPKGSLIEHRNVVRLLKTDKPLFDFTNKDVWTMFHSACFDFSVWEMYGALLFGGKLVIISALTAKDTSLFVQALKKENVTVLNQTPSAFYNLVKEELEHEDAGLKLRYVIFGGEALSPSRLKNWKKKYPATELINMYGITETTVHVTYKKITDEEIQNNSSNIGQPIPTLSCYVLDANQQLMPVGVYGELYVGGEGVCRGYLNRPELTNAKFIANPFKDGERLYRSGDKVRLLQNGEMEYAGRIDEQVKIRGYRIELGEIESAIRKYASIADGVVMARKDNSGDVNLVAYITATGKINTTNLHQSIAAQLPAYMLPNYYVQLDAMPLTSNGKINRKMLPDPAEMNTGSASDYTAPQNQIQQKLVTIWQELLDRQNISITDNFFEIGGHSLKATRLASQIHKMFNVKLSLGELFSNPVLEDQAQLIASATSDLFTDIPLVPGQSSYPLSSSQYRLWVLCQVDAGNVAYNIPGVYLLEGELDKAALERSFAALIERHEILRTVFKEDEQGEIRQFILPALSTSFPISCHDLCNEQQALHHFLEQDNMQPFDLTTGPLHRASLYKLSPGKWVFSYVIHHIISDGWSMNILINEVLQLYAAFTNNAANPLKPLRIQFKDYAAWHHKQLSDGSMNMHRHYWHDKLSGDLPVLSVPTDFERPAVKTYNGASIDFFIPLNDMKSLMQVAIDNNMTLNMALLGIINILLHTYTGQEDIIIGMPVAGREHADLAEQVGFYVNTLALRNRISGTDTLQEVFDHTKQTVSEAYSHQQYPFETLVDELLPDRDPRMNPFFEVMAVLQNNEGLKSENVFSNDKLSVSAMKDTYRTSRFDLNFNMREVDGGLSIFLEYNSDLYKPISIEIMGNKLLHLIKDVPADMNRTIDQLVFTTLHEQDEPILEWEMNF